MKKRRLAIPIFLAAAVVYTSSLIMVLIVSQQDQRQPVDAIVVLGAAQYNGRPSPVFRARLDHALGLYRERLAPLVVVTGGVGRGDTMSEATGTCGITASPRTRSQPQVKVGPPRPP